MDIIAVTGTCGKTTSVHLTKHIFASAGYSVGTFGTMGVSLGDEIHNSKERRIREWVSYMEKRGCDYFIAEIYSRLLKLDRCAGWDISVGAFTNLSRDHLDFHETMEDYVASKAKLAPLCRQFAANVDDPYEPVIASGAKGDIYTYSTMRHWASLYAADILLYKDHVEFTAVEGTDKAKVCLNIPGRFSVYNALTAISCARLSGVPLIFCAEALSTAPNVKGRIEKLDVDCDCEVYVDFAHTPVEIEAIAEELSKHGRLTVVFGCGGKRDRGKRPMMMQAAQKYATYTVVTNDNPRDEDENQIFHDILEGADPSKPYTVMTDRVKAIRHALSATGKDGIVLLAGKGHETGQEVNGRMVPMDERRIVEEWIKDGKECDTHGIQH